MPLPQTIGRLLRTVAVALGGAIVVWLLVRLLKVERVRHALRVVFNLLPDIVAIFLALVLGAIGIALFFLPEEVKQLEGRRRLRVAIAVSLMGLAVLFGAGGMVSNSVQKQEDKEAAQKDRETLMGILNNLVQQQRLAATNLELQQAQLGSLAANVPQAVKAPPPPDVTLRFVYPESPALVLVNDSNSIARQIKWTVALWNMDTPQRNDPLPILTTVFDWIRPHDTGGPENLFDASLVKPLLNPGNRLFGSAAVICPECKRGRTFIVYIVWGQGGWYSEVPQQTSGRVLVPPQFLRPDIEAYFRYLEATVPQQSRIPIQ